MTRFNPIDCANVLGVLPQGPITTPEITRVTDEINRRKEDLVDQVYWSSTKSIEAQRRTQQERILTKFYKELGTLVTVHPKETPKIQDFLTRWLDYSVGKAGDIKTSIDEMRNTIDGILHTASRIESARRINKLKEFGQGLIQRYNLNSRELEEIIRDTIEVGSIDRELYAVGNTAAAQAMNQRRFYEYQADLLTRGIDQADIDTLINLSHDVSTTFAEVATIARAFGVSVNQLENLGYVTRVLTSLGRERMRDVIRPEDILDTQTLANMTLTSVLNTNRKTNVFAVEDLAALARITGIAEDYLFMKGNDYVKNSYRITQEEIQNRIVPDIVMPKTGKNIITIQKENEVEALLNVLVKLDKNVGSSTRYKQLKNSITSNANTIKRVRQFIKDLYQASNSNLDGVYIKFPGPNDSIVTNFLDLSGNSLQDFDYMKLMAPLVENPFYLLDYMRSRMTSEQVDLLVESGILTRMPMSSREMFDYFNNKYAWNFERPSDMINMNIEEVFQTHLNNLQHAARNSGMILGAIGEDGLRNGWSILPSDPRYINNPTEYASYVPLGNFAKQLENIGIPRKDIERINRQLVHPRVAKQFAAYIWMSVDPARLSQTAYVLSEIARTGNKINLLKGGTGYIARNTLTNIIMAQAAGNNLLRILPAIKNLKRMFVEGIDWIPQEKFAYMSFKRGEPKRWFTKKEFTEQFLNRHASNYTPQVIGDTPIYTGESIAQWLSRKGKDVPGTIAKSWDYVTARAESVGWKNIGLPDRAFRLGKVLTNGFRGLVSEAFSPFGFYANFIELGTKMSTYESLANKPGIEMGQIMTSGQFRYAESFEELDEMMREAFVRPENAGLAEKILSDWYAPFLRYSVQTPMMVFKAMIRKPSVFMVYGKWRAINQEVEQKKADLTAAGFQSWELSDYPYVLFTDPKEGQVGLLMPNNFDPISKTWTDTTELVNSILRIGFNEPVGTPQQIRSIYKDRGQLDEFSRAFLQNAYDWWQIPYELFSGQDAFTGRPLESKELNKRYSWNGLALPWYWITILERVPFLSELDKLNPGGIYGLAPLKDANGNLILDENGKPVEPGKLSVFGAERRPGADKKKYDLRTQSLVYQALRLSGLNIRVVDYNRNLQATYTDMKNLTDTMASQINSTREAIATDMRKDALVDRQDLRRRLNQLDENISKLGYLLIEKYKLERYMLSQDKFGGRVLPKEYISELDRLSNQVEFSTTRQISGLPYPGQQKIEEVSQYIAEQFAKNQELFQELETPKK